MKKVVKVFYFVSKILPLYTLITFSYCNSQNSDIPILFPKEGFRFELIHVSKEFAHTYKMSHTHNIIKSKIPSFR